MILPFFQPIDKHSPIPRYFQVENTIQSSILDGDIEPGDQLPTEKELCDHFSVSRSVIRPALHNLVLRGLIERVPGRGTFVTQPKLREALMRELLGFHEDTIRQGHQPATKILEQERIPATPALAELFGIDVNDPVLFLKRLRFLDHEPHLISETYLRLDIQPALANEDFSDGSFYQLLEKRYGLFLSHGRRVVEVALASVDEAHLLEIQPGAPLLLLTSLAFLDDERPIEYSIGKHRADRTRFEVDLIRTRSNPAREPR
jgi:GntR family transcriptional regulator